MAEDISKTNKRLYEYVLPMVRAINEEGHNALNKKLDENNIIIVAKSVTYSLDKFSDPKHQEYKNLVAGASQEAFDKVVGTREVLDMIDTLAHYNIDERIRDKNPTKRTSPISTASVAPLMLGSVLVASRENELT